MNSVRRAPAVLAAKIIVTALYFSILTCVGSVWATSVSVDQFKQALQQGGWAVSGNPDGGSEPAPAAVSASSDRAVIPDTGEAGEAAVRSQRSTTQADQLRKSLEKQGWTPVKDKDGNVYYLPPRATPTPSVVPPSTDDSEDSTERSTLQEQLENNLKRGGWHAVTAQDGSVYYLPPGGMMKGMAADSAGGDSDRSTQGQTEVAAGQTENLAEQLRAELERQGWTAAPAEDGGVYYLPPGRAPNAPVAENPLAVIDPQGADSAVQAPSLAEQLREQLELRGWTAAPADDGGVYYLPPEPVEDSAPVPEPNQDPLEPVAPGDDATGAAQSSGPSSLAQIESKGGLTQPTDPATMAAGASIGSASAAATSPDAGRDASSDQPLPVDRSAARAMTSNAIPQTASSPWMQHRPPFPRPLYGAPPAGQYAWSSGPGFPPTWSDHGRQPPARWRQPYWWRQVYRPAFPRH